MHICYVKSRVNINLGGANESLHMVAQELVNEGYEVSLLTLSPEDNRIPSDASYRHIDLDVSVSKPGERIDQVLPEVLTANDKNIDIFHGFGPKYGPALAKYSGGTSAKTVVRLNSYGIFCFNMSQMDGTCHQTCNVVSRFKHYDGPVWKSVALLPIMGYAARRLNRLNEIDHICAQSPPIEKIYTEAGVEQPPKTVVPNIYNDSFGTRPSSTVEFDSDSFDLLFTGRLVPEKGLDTLIETAREVEETCVIHIVGDGPLLDRLRKESPNNVICHGYIDHDELPAYYHATDAFVHPATYPDPCPRGVLEAMSAGLPLIVSDQGAPSWMAGESCLTFSSGNPTSLVERIEEIKSDAELRRSLAQSTGAELRKFERDTIIQRYTEVYETVMSTA